MFTLLRFLRLLTVVIWVGGLIFFAFVLAPVAFHLLPSTHAAGIVVGGSLRVLHVAGLLCGVLFGVSTATLLPRSNRPARAVFSIELLLVFLMLVATIYLQAIVLPAMERDRVAAGGDIETSGAANPARIHFNRLHDWSERIEGAVLFAGLGIVALMSREPVPLKQ